MYSMHIFFVFTDGQYLYDNIMRETQCLKSPQNWLTLVNFFLLFFLDYEKFLALLAMRLNE